VLSTIGSAVEVKALALAGEGARSEAVYTLRQALATYGGTIIQDELRSSLTLLSLEGQPARALEPGVSVGSRIPHGADVAGRVQLIFFWAHWCPECKAESATLAKLAEIYGREGLVIVAPTRRYGYVESGRAASPERELRHIVQVRDTYYPFLKSHPVPVTDENYKTYGVAAVPMHVLIDRQGVVRLYQQGRMTEAELTDAVARLLEH
jgi:thiol-disulfide isomerase/thioredoxin